MVNIAIVEDEDPAARVLEEFLKRYEREHGGTAFNVSRYRDAETFLSDVAVGGYGIVLMDIVSNKDGRVAMRTTDIKYVEVVQHMLIWHTTHGDVRASGQLSDAEKLLSGEPFAYCNRCYYVNLRFVTALRGHEVYLGDECLVVSRMKRAAFADALSAFLAGGG